MNNIITVVSDDSEQRHFENTGWSELKNSCGCENLITNLSLKQQMLMWGRHRMLEVREMRYKWGLETNGSSYRKKRWVSQLFELLGLSCGCMVYYVVYTTAKSIKCSNS